MCTWCHAYNGIYDFATFSSQVLCFPGKRHLSHPKSCTCQANDIKDPSPRSRFRTMILSKIEDWDNFRVSRRNQNAGGVCANPWPRTRAFSPTIRTPQGVHTVWGT
jgi:hypothetical protein